MISQALLRGSSTGGNNYDYYFFTMSVLLEFVIPRLEYLFTQYVNYFIIYVFSLSLHWLACYNLYHFSFL